MKSKRSAAIKLSVPVSGTGIFFKPFSLPAVWEAKDRQILYIRKRQYLDA